MVERQQALRLVLHRRLDPELVEEQPEEVEGLEPRIEDEGRGGVGLELREQRVEQRGLARADFAREHAEALARLHRVDERGGSIIAVDIIRIE